MRLFKTPPFDQHLVLGNKELVGDKESLANLKLLPGSVVYLWVIVILVRALSPQILLCVIVNI